MCEYAYKDPGPTIVVHSENDLSFLTDCINSFACKISSVTLDSCMLCTQAGNITIIAVDSDRYIPLALTELNHFGTSRCFSVSAELVSTSDGVVRIAILSVATTCATAHESTESGSSTTAVHHPHGAAFILVAHFAKLSDQARQQVLQALCKPDVSLVTEDRMAGGENSLLCLLQRDCSSLNVQGMGAPGQNNFDIREQTSKSVDEFMPRMFTRGWDELTSGNLWKVGVKMVGLV